MFHNLRILSLFLLAALLLSFPAWSQKVFYVTPTGSGANDGSSWAAAYPGTQLQTAIETASTYWQDHQDQTVQVWVAAGVYKPTTGTDRTISFTMRDHVGIYGGFLGTETALSQRPSITHSQPSSTTLSGDIGEPGNRDDNTYHVIINYNITLGESAILDGFVVSGGNADYSAGGGISNRGRSCRPVIRNCSFRGNKAGSGGGMSNSDASPQVSNCSFIDNLAYVAENTGSRGGAVYTSLAYGLPIFPFVNCLFQGNSTIGEGGAIGLSLNHPVPSTFLISTNCTFVDNSAYAGGAVRIIGSSLAILQAINSLFWGNGGANTFGGFSLTATNCLFEETVTRYSGDGNLTATTRPFASETNLQLTPCSPAVNAGDPNSTTATSGTTDLDGNPRFYGGRIDIGALELQVQQFSGQDLAITQPPGAASTVCAGSTITVPVAATATTTITYQWFKDNSPLTPAQTTATLSLTGVQTHDAGSYVLVLTTACESLTTTAFNLTVNPVPVVTINPGSRTLCAGETTTLTAAGATTYRWSDQSTAASLTVATSGPVSVTGTTLGCWATATATVTVKQALAAPILSSSPTATSATSLTILQNTPFVSLTAEGCAGTLVWSGAYTGSQPTVSVPTSATGTFSYSVLCQFEGCSSPPSPFEVTVIPAPVSGNFDGFIYGADCGTFRGWTWDRGKPNTVQSVDILDGPTWLATIPANEFRQDLKDAGKGNGIHAFRWNIPESLKDGQVHYLSARVAGSSFFLKDSPKALICAGGTTSPPNKQPVAPTVSALTAQQGVAFSTVLPVFTDPEGSTLSYGLITLPTGLSFTSATRQLSGTPTQSGVFVLSYSATDEPGATNSVSFNLTVHPAASTPVTGSFEGYLDKVECGTIRGWVWDRNKPNTPVSVEFYTGSTVWGSTVANIYRVDLLNAGKGNGAHAYSFEVPVALKDGVTRSIRARVLGSSYDLKDSGKPLTCNSPARLSAEAGSELQVRVLGNPVTDQVEVEIRGAEGQSLRLQLEDGSGRLVSQRQLEVAKPVERQTFSVQDKPGGLYLLRVSSGQKTMTVKVVKP
ncbi:putative Ig domain-containing protein [Larkinella bovis]|uniref:Ig domain-containing protein n=1 Tax=Larkinella bovis TaxID=683041 RepID=A0ABW0IGA1_9BACT